MIYCSIELLEEGICVLLGLNIMNTLFTNDSQMIKLSQLFDSSSLYCGNLVLVYSRIRKVYFMKRLEGLNLFKPTHLNLVYI